MNEFLRDLEEDNDAIILTEEELFSDFKDPVEDEDCSLDSIAVRKKSNG